MATTFGMEFEVQGISPSRAAERLNLAGIECNNPRAQHETDDQWKAVYDGSVSNGAEVVSPILNAARLNEAHKVTKVLKSAGARVDRATGFHVHIGLDAFRDEQGNFYDNVAKFTLNWYAAHNAIGALVAPSRLNNRYCRVLSRDAAERQAEYTRNQNSGAYDSNRYVSLNLESMRRHGTIEIRLHQGTLNGVKAIAWAQFVAGLIDATKAGLDMTAQDDFTAWRWIPSPADCNLLMDKLVGLNTLTASTGDWLKGRAGRLNA